MTDESASAPAPTQFFHVYCRDGEHVRPMATFAAVTSNVLVEGRAVVYVGFALCSAWDSFVYTRGREIALGRARCAMREEKDVAWTDKMAASRFEALRRDIEVLTACEYAGMRLKIMNVLTRYGFLMRRRLGRP